MNRDSRVNDPALAHFLTFSCHKKLPLFKFVPICEIYVQSLINSRNNHHFDIWAYVIIPNHIHMVIWPKDVAVETILHSIKRPTAFHALKYLRENHPQIMPSLHVSRGTRSHERFWMHGGGHDFPLYKPVHVATKMVYTHENPVRAGLVETAELWPWSSARFWVNGDPDPLPMDDILFPLPAR